MEQHRPSFTFENSGWHSCACCGTRFRLLNQPNGLPSISARSLAQQRAYQCANCGKMVCRECIMAGYHCLCKTNAWVARSVFMRKRQALVRMTMADPGEMSGHSMEPHEITL